MHYVSGCRHKDRTINICVCLCVSWSQVTFQHTLVWHAVPGWGSCSFVFSLKHNTGDQCQIVILSEPLTLTVSFKPYAPVQIENSSATVKAEQKYTLATTLKAPGGFNVLLHRSPWEKILVAMIWTDTTFFISLIQAWSFQFVFSFSSRA